MKPPVFDYVRPSSLDAALALRDEVNFRGVGEGGLIAGAPEPVPAFVDSNGRSPYDSD